MNVGHHYISYSQTSAQPFAASLVIELERRSPDLRCWVAVRDASEASSLLEQVDGAIRRCSSMIAIIADPADLDDERAVAEWRLAISYNKPITVVRAAPGLPCPLSLDTRKSVDFSMGRDQAILTLADRLTGLSTPDGQLETLREQLAASRRASTYAPPANKSRFFSEITALEQQIAALAASPHQAKAAQERMASELELRRRALTERDEVTIARLRVVNAPPLLVPHYFENRDRETALIARFLRDAAFCIATVHGRGGVGKTAMVCRVLRELENDVLPDNGGPLKVAAVIYINATRVSSGLFPQVVSGLLATLDKSLQDELRPTLDSPDGTVATSLKALLPRLPHDPTVVLLDNFEDVLSKEDGRIRDTEIAELLRALTEYPYHPLKIIITTRIVPEELIEASPDRHAKILLKEGLQSPHAEAVLKKLDFDGSAGFKNASAQKLTAVAEVTRGFPRALVAFYSIIEADPSKEIEELVADLKNAAHPEDKITAALVGEAYSRLLPIDQRVIQSIAIFGRPVLVTAVEFVLGDWAPYVDTPTILKRLVAMQFVRHEARTYHLHPIDRDYALSCLAEHEKNNLKRLAAEYFQEISRPRSQWKTLADIEPHLEQFRLRIEARDAETAAFVLSEIWTFLIKRGGFEQALSLAHSLATVATEERDKRIALSYISHAQWRSGRIREAVAAQQCLIDTFKPGEALDELFIAKGNLLIYQQQLGATEELLNSSRELLAEQERRFPWEFKNLAACHEQLASCLEELGYLAEALEQRQRAMDIAARSMDMDFREAQLHNLGASYEALSQAQRAEDLYRQALDLADENGNPLWKANHLAALARCADAQGRFAEARQLNAESLKIYTEIGDLDGIARGMRREAEYFLAAGAIDKAADIANRAREHVRDLKRPLREYTRTYAEIKLTQGKVAEAYRLLTEQKDALPGATWDLDNLLGTVQLRLQLREEAGRSFSRSLPQCELWLSRSSENHSACAAKALALAGLAACGEPDALQRAKDAYRSAVRLDTGPGIISRMRRQLEQLAMAVNLDLLNDLLTDVFPFKLCKGLVSRYRTMTIKTKFSLAMHMRMLLGWKN